MGTKSNIRGYVSCIAALCILSTSVNAAVDAIQPGAVLPGEAPQIPQAEPELIPIPPMIDRPLGDDEGPVINVKTFKIQNALVRPGLGITQQAAQNIADQAIQDNAGQFTIGRLQRVADAITNYYRQAGMILARVVVPSQDVEQNTVLLNVLPGKLGSVVAEGNQHYSLPKLTEPFADLVGKPVDKASVESALLYLTDYPGAQLFGVFRPGKQEGETEMLLKMQDERQYALDAQFNNYGSEYTGDYNARISASWLNPTGSADQLDLGLLYSFEPTNNLYGSLGYRIPIFSHEHLLGFSYVRNAFDVGEALALQDISGESEVMGAYYQNRFLRGRLVNAEFQLGLNSKRSQTTRSDTVLGEDMLSVLQAQLKADFADDFLGGGITQATVSASQGLADFLGSMDNAGNNGSSRFGGSGERAGGDFSKLNLSVVRLQQLSKNQSLLLRFEGQYSPDLLVSLEQSAIGGPTNVRAYGPSEFLRDSSIFGSIEWIIRAPGFADEPAFGDRTWGEVLQVSLFYDAAKGWLNDPLGSEAKEVDLYGPGVGLQFNFTRELSARLDVAFPSAVSDPENGRDPQYYFNINYNY